MGLCKQGGPEVDEPRLTGAHARMRTRLVDPLSRNPRRAARLLRGQSPLIGLRISDAELERIDRFARRKGVSRSEALRLLIRSGLARSR